MTGRSEDAGFKKFVIGPLCTNCYLIWEKSSGKGVLIDPAVYDRGIQEYIQDNGIDVEFIVNTHGHADHIGGNASFGYPVLIHELDEPCLRDSAKNLSFLAGENIICTYAERMLADGDIISVGGLRLEIIHTPGHTPGSVSIKCGDILFSGDALFHEGVGRTDIPGGAHEVLMRSIRGKLLALPDSVKVFPGHGPETTIGHERKSNPFF